MAVVLVLAYVLVILSFIDLFSGQSGRFDPPYSEDVSLKLFVSYCLD